VPPARGHFFSQLGDNYATCWHWIFRSDHCVNDRLGYSRREISPHTGGGVGTPHRGGGAGGAPLLGDSMIPQSGVVFHPTLPERQYINSQ